VITVVIVAFNSAAVLRACLDSLPGAFEGAGDREVLVVDNASTDATTALVAAAPGVRLVEMGRNAGYAAAVNAGVAASEADGPVLILNPDVVLAPGAVAHLARTLEMSGTGIAVPRLDDADGTTRWSLRREPTILRAFGEAVLGGRRAGRFERLGEFVVTPSGYRTGAVADWATGSAMLVSRRCLQAVGPWDEAFFLYSEETDFALRARDAGFALRYAAEAVLVHHEGDWETSPELWALLTCNRVLLFRKRHGPLGAAVYRAALVLNEALRAAGPTHRAALAALLVPGRRGRIIDGLQQRGRASSSV